jgi:hypothetical protein
MSENFWQRFFAAHSMSEFEAWEVKRHKRRRKRLPTLASVSKQALKAGVTRATLAPDGMVTLEFGTASNDAGINVNGNSWDDLVVETRQ